MKTNSYLNIPESARADIAEHFSSRLCGRIGVRRCASIFLLLAVATAGNLRALAQAAAPPPPPPSAPAGTIVIITTNAPGGGAQITLPTTNSALEMQITTNAPATDAQTLTNAPVAPSVAVPELVTAASTNVFPGTAGPNGLTMIFRNAPLSQVFTYLVDVAGFIVEGGTRVSGTITVQGKEMTRDEAVGVLSRALNDNGYGIIREERTLRIINQSDVASSHPPVRIGGVSTNIPKNAEIVTQVIPVNFVEAAQLVRDLAPMISPHAIIIPNEAGNEIIVTDTQANIRHLVEIIEAIDASAETGTEIKVFHLTYHDPQEVADILTQLFSNQGNSSSPISFNGGRGGRGGGGRGGGGRGGGGGGAFGGGGPAGFFAALTGANAGGNNQADRIKRRDQVVAQADERTSTVIVMADKGLMEKIGDMIERLDVPSDKVASVTTAKVKFGDAQQIAQELQYMFQTGNAARNASTANQNSALTQRQQQQMQQNSTTTGFGTSGARGGAGGGISF